MLFVLIVLAVIWIRVNSRIMDSLENYGGLSCFCSFFIVPMSAVGLVTYALV